MKPYTLVLDYDGQELTRAFDTDHQSYEVVVQMKKDLKCFSLHLYHTVPGEKPDLIGEWERGA